MASLSGSWSSTSPAGLRLYGSRAQSRRWERARMTHESRASSLNFRKSRISIRAPSIAIIFSLLSRANERDKVSGIVPNCDASTVFFSVREMTARFP